MGINPAWKPWEINPATISAGSGAGVAALVEWLDGAVGRLQDLLDREKALVFRGFGITEGQLDPVTDRLLPNRLAYVHGNSPRTKVGDNVYTSTEYPEAGSMRCVRPTTARS
ncbi:Fe(II)-2OG oxygenase family protein [Streptomyces griseorubiginosus]|uniref:hypothetical protein n=1 Tax=Streptomyces griseorubiginosus TaxID=67304 RepID=UPI00365CB56C